MFLSCKFVLCIFIEILGRVTSVWIRSYIITIRRLFIRFVGIRGVLETEGYSNVS